MTAKRWPTSTLPKKTKVAAIGAIKANHAGPREVLDVLLHTVAREYAVRRRSTLVVNHDVAAFGGIEYRVG